MPARDGWPVAAAAPPTVAVTITLQSMPEPRGAAFFDLDRTLMSGSSGAQFGRAAFRSGMVSRRQMTRWGIEHLRFRLRGATDRDTDELVKQIRELLEGVPERALKRMVPDLLAGILPRIYPQMLAEVRSHQDAGRPTFIVSAAGHGVVELLANVLDMEGGIGTRYEVGQRSLHRRARRRAQLR